MVVTSVAWARSVRSALPKRYLKIARARALFHTGVAARRIAGDPRPIVLAFHNVVRQQSRPVLDRFCITADAFRAQLQKLGEIVEFVSWENLRGRSAPRKPRALVTFDDGFAGVHTHALPVLRESGVPALVNLTAGLIDSRRTVWSLEIDLITLTADVEKLSILLPDGSRDLLPLTTPAERKAARLLIRRAAQDGGDDFPLRLVDDLIAQIGAASFEALMNEHEHLQMLTTSQVSELVAAGCDIGVHGFHHLPLGSLSATQLEREVHGARADLRAKFHGSSLDVFCLPYGSTSPTLLEYIRGAQFRGCLTSAPGRVSPGEWTLPRFDGGVSAVELFAAIASASEPRPGTEAS